MKVTIDSVEKQADRWFVAKTHTDADGTSTKHAHVFPLDILEWRAAEYGIPHTDTQTLLDIVLAEVHMTSDDWAKGHQLGTAPDIDTARKDHLARVAQIKQRHGLTSGAGDPLKRVRDESPLHPEVVAVKAEHVAQTRQHVQRQAHRAQQAATAAAPSGAERAAAMRQQLGFNDKTPVEPQAHA